MRKIAKRLDAACSELEKLTANNPNLGQVASSDNRMANLKKARDYFSAFEKSKHGAVPSYAHLGRLLIGLEEIYVAAGGKKRMGITRYRTERKSQFIDFAWPIVKTLHPVKYNALAATWESVLKNVKERRPNGPLRLIRRNA